MTNEGLNDITRPDYVWISGSYVLRQIKNAEWYVGDCDIYINTEADNFNIRELCKFYKQLLDIGFKRHIPYRIVNNINLTASKAIKQFVSDIHYLKEQSIYYEYENNNHVNVLLAGEDPYISGTNFNVIKMFNKHKKNIDIILIKTDIKSYMKTDFDLSIVKNYINNNNEIISLYPDHVEKNVSEYKYELFKSRLSIMNHVQKFAERIIKYDNRGFKIYMSFSYVKNDCYLCQELKDITCECNIRLNKENLKNILIPALNIIFKYYTYDYKVIKFSFTDDCKIHITKYKMKNGNINDTVIIKDFTNILKSSKNKIMSEILQTSILRLRNMIELSKLLASPKYLDIEFED